jgi:hypothetical protein
VSGGRTHGPACKHEPATAAVAAADGGASTSKPSSQAPVGVARRMAFGAAAAEIATAGASSGAAASEAREHMFGTMAGWSNSVLNEDDLSSCY